VVAVALFDPRAVRRMLHFAYGYWRSPDELRSRATSTARHFISSRLRSFRRPFHPENEGIRTWYMQRGNRRGTCAPLQPQYKRYYLPRAKGRYAKFATSGTALRAMIALPATAPAYIELLGSLAAQALLVHGNSCPLAAIGP